MDWAMKFLPHLFREKMSDWFGQKSIHWHCAVSIFRDEDGTLKHKTFTNTMDVVKQDFFAVLLVLEHLLQTIKTQLPKITEVYLRSDNAGCYHCGHLWLSLPDLSQRTGIKILGYDFSEPQSGKSYCDAKIAHMRGKIRSHAAEGHNISTAYEVNKAIECGKGIQGVQAAVVDINTNNQKIQKHSWKGVSFLSNISFCDGGIITWRAYNVGEGNFTTQETVDVYSKVKQTSTDIHVVSDFSNSESLGNIKEKSLVPSVPEDLDSVHVDHTVQAQNDEDHTVDAVNDEDDNDNNVFYCPEEGCGKIYKSYNKLEDHIYIGKHDKKLMMESSYDKAKKLWASKCQQISDRSKITTGNTANTNVPCNKVPSLGWALKKEKKCVRFTQKVKDYLTELFVKGETTGRKENPANVAIEMRNIKDNGERKFSPEEWLQPSQITSFFSRLSLSAAHPSKNKKLAIDTVDIEDGNDDDLLSVLNLLDNNTIIETLDI